MLWEVFIQKPWGFRHLERTLPIMAEGVTSDVFDDVGFVDRFFHSPLKDCFVYVMTSFLSGFGVLPTFFLGKYPLPAPLSRSIGIFAVQGIMQQQPCSVKAVVGLKRPWRP